MGIAIMYIMLLALVYIAPSSMVFMLLSVYHPCRGMSSKDSKSGSALKVAAA